VAPRSHTSELRRSYNKLAAECRIAIHSQIHSHVTKQEERLVDNGNIGALYRYANNKFSFKSAIGNIQIQT